MTSIRKLVVTALIAVPAPFAVLPQASAQAPAQPRAATTSMDATLPVASRAATCRGTVESIDRSHRLVVLQDDDRIVVIRLGPEVQHFDRLAEGDAVQVPGGDLLTLRVSDPTVLATLGPDDRVVASDVESAAVSILPDAR
jgi:hypothetical protein